MNEVDLVKADNLAEIVLNRPAKLNAMTPEMARLVFDAVQDINTDPKVRVAILRSDCDRAFCAGSDVSSFTIGGRWPTPMDYHNRDIREDYAKSIRTCIKPIIAAINGYCLGGGLDMAVNCDIRVASVDATLGAPEIVRGWFGSGAKAQLLPRMIGLGAASHLMLTGTPIDANEAYRIGLVQELSASTDLHTRARQLASSIAKFSPLASQATKLALRGSTELPLSAGDSYENELVTLSFYYHDKDANITNFLAGEGR